MAYTYVILIYSTLYRFTNYFYLHISTNVLLLCFCINVLKSYNISLKFMQKVHISLSIFHLISLQQVYIFNHKDIFFKFYTTFKLKFTSFYSTISINYDTISNSNIFSSNLHSVCSSNKELFNLDLENPIYTKVPEKSILLLNNKIEELLNFGSVVVEISNTVIFVPLLFIMALNFFTKNINI
jgi:hypothetical protein